VCVKQEPVTDVWSGQRTEEGGRQVLCVVYRHATGDKKSKDAKEGQEKKEGLRVDGCPERTKSKP
jgi:hypothetical protein